MGKGGQGGFSRGGSKRSLLQSQEGGGRTHVGQSLPNMKQSGKPRAMTTNIGAGIVNPKIHRYE